ncbi:ATP-binding protein [Streptomyces sp. NPDC054796]
MAWCAGVAGVLLVGTVMVALYRVRRLQQRVESRHAALQHAEEELEQMRSQLEELVQHTLPWVLGRIQERDSAATILAEGAGRLPREPVARRLAEQLVELLYQERRRRNAAVSVMQECAHRVQAGVTDLLAEISRRKQPYWEENTESVSRVSVRADFEGVDARTSSLGMLTQRLLALTGARRIGRPWPRPIALPHVLRAAVGATENYQRVQALPAVPVAVASPAVNAAIQVLAEVLDNALRFSPPTTQVWVSAEEVGAGVVVYVDDSGLVMPAATLAQVRRTVDPDCPLDVGEISGGRLGLVAARLSAERYGFRIAFGPSPSGGTRVSVLFPRQWLTPAVTGQPTELQPPAPGPVSTSPCAASRGAERPEAGREAVRAASAPAVGGLGPSGLPKRTPRATLRDSPERDVPPEQPRTAEETARRFSSFRAATRRSRDDAPPTTDAEPPR